MNLVVRDLMHVGLYTCSAEATLGQVAAALSRRRVHAVAVAGSQGELLGMISDMDLLAGEWQSTSAADLELMRSVTAAEVMSRPVATIAADSSLPAAARRLTAEKISRLVVIEQDRPVGVISVSDLVGSLQEPASERHCVGDVMSRGIVVCREHTSLAQAARSMVERRTRSLVVVDDDGRSLGVVIGLDLLAIVETGARPATVAELMHPPAAIGPDATLREAADLMLNLRRHRLLVVDPARPRSMPLGLITTSDIVEAMAAPGSVWQQED